ncbi:MAG: prepilin-type N-terminal cleavage/methylation domain-containing protein [bacterium]|nr:prepilin-type N-terminal cleavage/methylation domain-containing protein [bacterium]
MKRSESERGFTLLELAVVIAMIGVMAGIAVPRFVGLNDSAEAAACRQNQSEIRNACTMYIMDDTNPNPGHYPAQVGDLVPRYFDAEPECPVVGRYGYDPADGTVTCGEAGHGT